MAEATHRFHQRSAEAVVRRAIKQQGLIIKTCQFLGSRADVLMDEYVTTLSLVHDQVPPRPWSEIRPVIEHELGGPIDTLYAEFDPYEVIRPFATRFFLKRLRDPKFIARPALTASREYWELLTSFPGSARRALDHLAKGKLSISTHIQEIERYSDEQRRATNRLAVAILTAAGALGSAVLIGQADTAVNWWGTLGAVATSGLSIALLWMILRSGKL